MSVTRENARVPVMLSAFVYPGAGQFFQKRWAAGALYALLFTAATLALILSVVVPILANLAIVLDWSATHTDKPLTTMSAPAILLSLFANLAVYAANLVDVVRASRRFLEPPVLPRG